MKTILKISSCFILTLLLFTFSCSSDDDSGGSDTFNVDNLVTNFDENPLANASIATIQATSSGTLSFSITSQTPVGALSISATTGELTVANAALFDFETNPIINATVSVIDPDNMEIANVTINLNDLDSIADFLTTSEVAYAAAADGDWVMVTEVEYNSLAGNLNEVSKIGSSDVEYNDASPIATSNPSSWVASNVTTANIPNNSYVYAFKYHAVNVTDNITSKVKLSSSISDGYSDLGGVLPTHSGTSVDVHFVLKGSNVITPAGYIAFYKGQNVILGLKNITGNQSYYWVGGDVNSGLSIQTDYKILYQGLSTTQKQW